MIEEIHKDCGGIIDQIVLTSMPPINVSRCRKCGAEKAVRQEIITIETEF